MEKDLKIEEYRTLLKNMDSLCSKMSDVIFLNYFDSNKYLYGLYDEAFKSIKGVCVLLGNGGLITQSAAILRMAIEKTATIRVLEMHKELQNIYAEHRRLRFELRDKESKERNKLIKEHFKGMEHSDIKQAANYLEYGWFKTIKADYGIDELIELSKIQEQDDAIKNWKNQLNQFVHGNYEFANLVSSIDAPIEYSHIFIEIAAKLLDIIVVEFHNENKFNFVINKVDYRKHFLNAYKVILSE